MVFFSADVKFRNFCEKISQTVKNANFMVVEISWFVALKLYLKPVISCFDATVAMLSYEKWANTRRVVFSKIPPAPVQAGLPWLPNNVISRRRNQVDSIKTMTEI